MYVEITPGMEKEQEIKDFLEKAKKKNKRGFWRLKRFVDALIALVILAVFALPMLIIGLVIYSYDKANPFYRQVRVGRHGKEFVMYKFRTMIPNAEQLLDEVLAENEMDEPVFKIKNDPRIIPCGKFLRAAGLDELPQLWNVIKGDMVLIGPRPPLPREVEQYTEYQKLRLTVTPGITCTWQIHPQRNDVPFDDWVEMDLDYILNRSVWSDFKILILTFFTVFKGEGQ